MVLTLAGAATAFGAQLFDSINQQKRDKSIETQIMKILSQLQVESTAATNILGKDKDILFGIRNQSTTANVSLNAIQDLLSRFDEVHIDAEFALPVSDHRVAALANDFHRWAQSGIPSIKGVPCNAFNIGNRNATIICVPLDSQRPELMAVLPNLASLNGIWSSMPL